jgi:hypothetical protein
MKKVRTLFLAAAAPCLVPAVTHGATVFHQLADFETGVPAFFAPQNGAILTQETIGATHGSSSLGVQFTDTRTTDAGPTQHIYMAIDATNNNFAKWQEAATLQATTDRQFALAYDMYLDFDGGSIPAGADLFASDLRYNQDPDPAAAVPVPGFQDTGGEYGLPTRYSSGFPTSDRLMPIVIPFDEADNPRSFFVNSNPSNGFYQLQLGHKYGPVGLGGTAKVFYDNFRILEYNAPQTNVLFSWETPDNPGTPENEQLEGWGLGASGSPGHNRSITTVGVTDGASAMRIGTGLNGFTWGSQVTFGNQTQVTQLADSFEKAIRVEADVTFTGGGASTTYFSFFMHISGAGHFFQSPASQFNDIQNLGVGESKTITIQFSMDDFRDANGTLRQVGLDGATSLAIGIGTNEGALNNVNISVDKLRVISEQAVAVETGDFNDDGIVNGADFLIWQRGFGVGSGASLGQGDGNGDGAVNNLDLAIWNAQYGTPGSAVSAAAVPEPTAGLLAAVALLAGVGLRGKTRRT